MENRIIEAVFFGNLRYPFETLKLLTVPNGRQV